MIKKHGDDNNSDFVILYFTNTKILADQTNPDSEDRSTILPATSGNLITFQLMALYACCDFTMTYYKGGTYNPSTQTGQRANINYVTGFYYDIDIPIRQSLTNAPFYGAEGIKPLNGTSQFYYDKNNINMNLKDKDTGRPIQCTVKPMDGRNMC